MNKRSFFDPDYIIEINEKRSEQLRNNYEKLLGRVSNILIVYTAIAFFLPNIIDDYFENRFSGVYWYCFFGFIFAFCVSIYFAVRFFIPKKVTQLLDPNNYYEVFKKYYIKNHPKYPQKQIDELIKTSYRSELEEKLEILGKLYWRKHKFYTKAINLSIIAAVPFIICVLFHIKHYK